MTDAAVDGGHIQALLLPFFSMPAPRLVERGHLYVAQPPLYKVEIPSQGKGKPARRVYCLDDDELEETLSALKKEKVKEGAWEISRFKGLGEMSPEQLWETRMNPDSRRLVRMVFDPKGIKKARETFELLMDSGEAEGRRNWMKQHWKTVEADIEIRDRPRFPGDNNGDEKKDQAKADVGTGVQGPRAVARQSEARQSDARGQGTLYVGGGGPHRRCRRSRQGQAGR